MTNVTSKIEETFQILSQAVVCQEIWSPCSKGLCCSLLNIVKYKTTLKKFIQAALN